MSRRGSIGAGSRRGSLSSRRGSGAGQSAGEMIPYDERSSVTRPRRGSVTSMRSNGSFMDGTASSRNKSSAGSARRELSRRMSLTGAERGEYGKVNPKGGQMSPGQQGFSMDTMGGFESGAWTKDPTVCGASSSALAATANAARMSGTRTTPRGGSSKINPRGGKASNAVGFDTMGRFESGAWTKDPDVCGASSSQLASPRATRSPSGVNPKGGVLGSSAVGFEKLGQFQSGGWTKDPTISGSSSTALATPRSAISRATRVNDTTLDLSYDPKSQSIPTNVTGCKTRKLAASGSTRRSPFAIDNDTLPGRSQGKTNLSAPQRDINPLTMSGVRPDAHKTRGGGGDGAASMSKSFSMHDPVALPQPGQRKAQAVAARNSSNAFSACNENLGVGITGTVGRQSTGVSAHRSNKDLLSYKPATAPSRSAKPPPSVQAARINQRSLSEANARMFGGGSAFGDGQRAVGNRNVHATTPGLIGGI